MTMRYRIDIAYDGTAYAGWQIQPNGLAIQEVIEKAITRMTSEQTKVHGSGRTDRGVHARQQVAHFDLAASFAPESFLKGLNANLPADVRVLKVRLAAPSFHARRSARAKQYRYFIWNGAILPPVRRRYAAHIRKTLNVGSMNDAAALLVGRHDFAAFSANPDRIVESTVRTLKELRVRKASHEVVIVASADGFLYKMVRSLAGFLIRVGEGAVPPSAAREILASKTRTATVPTAPPQGLFLWNVSY